MKRITHERLVGVLFAVGFWLCFAAGMVWLVGKLTGQLT